MRHPTLSELALYAGNDWGALTRWRVRRHITLCPACRQEVRANQAAREALRDFTAQMPLGVEWERLAEEMTGNIRVGLAAGECVGDFPVKRRSPLLRWNIAASMAMLVVLFAAAIVINMPRSDSGRLGGVVERLFGYDRSHQHTESIAAAPAFGVLEASPRLIAMHANGSTLSVAPDSASNVRVSVSLEGSAAARVVDSDTGQVTISRVYDEQ
ncbi:MAG TPA: hypothetical protein VFA04_06895 [Bryobacteraceae bacterium]|nr:hypothetical protein [Bryobacteraceae bacterium]